MTISGRARWLIIAAGLVLTSCLGKSEGEVPTTTADLALTDVQIVDVRLGVVRPGMTVLIDDGWIADVGPAERVPIDGAAEIIEGRGRYVIPGLWDLHVHTLWHESLAGTFLPLFVANGVTGVRDMGGVPELTSSWPGRIDDGNLLGPRIIAAGQILDGDPPLHPEVSIAIANPETARAAVLKMRADGYAFAKVYTLLSREAYFAIAEEARRLDFPFAGHPSGYVTPIEASEAGQRSIEHLAHGQPSPGRLDLSCVDLDGCTELLETFVRNRTWQVPTLVVLRAKAYSEEERYAEDPRLRYLPQMVRADYEASRARRLEEATPERVTERLEDWRRNSLLVGAMAEAGVPLGAGTDAGVLFSLPGFSLHEELELMVQAGLSPLEALRAATLAAAELLMLEDEIGAVEEGLAADLVLLERNPMEEISATTSIAAVVRAGRHYDRAALDGLLATVERNAQLE